MSRSAPIRTRAWLSALTLDDGGAPEILKTAVNKPLLVVARAGTHSAPGRDPLVPEYPGMRTPSAKNKNDGPR